jgi:hypothetical protein
MHGVLVCLGELENSERVWKSWFGFLLLDILAFPEVKEESEWSWIIKLGYEKISEIVRWVDSLGNFLLFLKKYEFKIQIPIIWI